MGIADVDTMEFLCTARAIILQRLPFCVRSIKVHFHTNFQFYGIVKTCVSRDSFEFRTKRLCRCIFVPWMISWVEFSRNRNVWLSTKESPRYQSMRDNNTPSLFEFGLEIQIINLRPYHNIFAGTLFVGIFVYAFSIVNYHTITTSGFFDKSSSR